MGSGLGWRMGSNMVSRLMRDDTNAWSLRATLLGPLRGEGGWSAGADSVPELW